MGQVIRSKGLADRVSYIRGDPSYVPFTFPSLFHPALIHRRRVELRLDYPNDTFDMVRLQYCSLHLAETEVSTTDRLTQTLADSASSGTCFCRSVHMLPFLNLLTSPSVNRRSIVS